MSWFRRPVSSRAVVPAQVVAAVPAGTRLLAAVPASADGQSWLLACEDGLRGVEVEAGQACNEQAGKADEGAAERPTWAWAGLTGWDRVTRARWDAESRAFTFHLLHGETRTLNVPAVVSQGGNDDGVVSKAVDEAAFGLAVRQQVERAIVHYVSQTLPGGVRVTASIRRGDGGSLYAVLDPDEESLEGEGEREAARALLRQVRDGVGLPTL